MSPRRKKDAVNPLLAQARAAGLSERTALLCVALQDQHPTDTDGLEQPEPDLIRAYAQARHLAEGFSARLHAAQWPKTATPGTRPNGVKSLERIVEKYLYSNRALFVPLDMLAGKLLVGSLWDMYDVASRVAAVFPVVGYRDRVMRPQAGGYRDLQFVVDVGGHYAELKVMHRLIDELDGFEHRLYEIRRGLRAREKEVNTLHPSGWGEGGWGDTPWGGGALTSIERLVLDTLEETSADLFKKAWGLVMAAEQTGGTP